MKKSTVAAALLLAISSMTMSAANADVIYYFTKTGLYNGPTIQDNNYFATATFTTNSGGGSIKTVNLTMTVYSGLDAGAYVNDWAFNVTSGLNIGSVSYVSGAQATKIDFGNNVVNNFGGTGGDFDLGISFSTANPGQLAVGASSVYKISGATGTSLTEANFNVANAAGLFSAVHVQGYGASSFYSGTKTPPTNTPLPPAAIPEPTTVALLGLGLLGVAASRRKSGKSKNV